jgi:hypothetical protein
LFENKPGNPDLLLICLISQRYVQLLLHKEEATSVVLKKKPAQQKIAQRAKIRPKIAQSGRTVLDN